MRSIEIRNYFQGYELGLERGRSLNDNTSTVRYYRYLQLDQPARGKVAEGQNLRQGRWADGQVPCLRRELTIQPQPWNWLVVVVVSWWQ